MGPGGYIGRLCLHVERSRWIHVCMCNALVLSYAKASTAALDSHASYLTAVLSSSAASVPPDFTSELVTRTVQVSSNYRQVTVGSASPRSIGRLSLDGWSPIWKLGFWSPL